MNAKRKSKSSRLEKLRKQLLKQANCWRDFKHDPHNINLPVEIALREVAEALNQL